MCLQTTAEEEDKWGSVVRTDHQFFQEFVDDNENTKSLAEATTYDVWHFFQFRKRKDRSDAYEVCCWLKGYQGLHWIEWDEKMFDNIQQYLSSGQQIVARDRSQLPPSLYSAWDHKKIIPWTTRQEVDKVNFLKYNLTSTGRRRCPDHIRI